MLKSPNHSLSLKQRMIMFMICGIIIPILLMQLLVINQTFQLYHKTLDAAMQNEIDRLASNVREIMVNMRNVSQQFIGDGTVSKRLDALYDSNTKNNGTALRELNEQINNVESANSNLGCITAFYIDENGKWKTINTSSLMKNGYTSHEAVFSQQGSFTYYGPHQTASRVSDYPVLSLVRKLSILNVKGEAYVYIESGFKQIERLLPKNVQGMDVTIGFLTGDQHIAYSTNEEILPVRTSCEELSAYERNQQKYVSYITKSDKDWGLAILMPQKSYDSRIYDLGIHYMMLSIVTIVLSVLVSMLMWYSVYKPFQKFDHRLKQISKDDNVREKIEKMNIAEFDNSFEYFSKLQKRILTLLQKVKQEEHEKSRLEIKQMFGKINPHFIHNTLDTLKWYAQGKGYNDIEKFVSSLNKLLMYSMEKDKVTTLKSEIAAINDYIFLQKLKYDLFFSIENTLPIQMMNAQMPRFILQPLVENVILHGTSNPCIIKIKISLSTDGKIIIAILSNGKPIDSNTIAQVLNSAKDLSSNGIGLQYVVHMLESYFGEDFAFRIETVAENENIAELIFPFDATTEIDTIKIGGMDHV